LSERERGEREGQKRGKEEGKGERERGGERRREGGREGEREGREERGEREEGRKEKETEKSKIMTSFKWVSSLPPSLWDGLMVDGIIHSKKIKACSAIVQDSRTFQVIKYISFKCRNMSLIE